ncbi:hypothetical protein [Silvimonas iriomotensis]|nr:hypothetical protein [Silvimonas iriomotensis]
MTDVHETLRQMRDHAEVTVLAQGGWLTADQMSGLARELCAEELKSWNAEGRIFTIERDGEIFYPSFALDPQNHYHPYPVLAALIKLYSGAGRSRWDLAFWLTSVNGYLRGLAPRALINGEEEVLLSAARHGLAPIEHG